MADKNTHTLPASSISPDDLNDLEQLLGDLKVKAQQSHDNGAIFMHGVYVRLIAIVSPIVISTHARMERNALADERKKLKAAKNAQPADAAGPMGQH